MELDRLGRMTPTVNDVAARAKVSRQTVSNVLNAPDRVRPATRRRVQRTIDELGYRPHRGARNLKSRRTGALGYLIQPTKASAVSSILDRFLHVLTDAAQAHGYHVLLFTRGDGPKDDVAAYDELIATSTVDGFVVSGTNYGDERVRHLLERQVPFAVFGRTAIEAPHAWVDVDNAAGTRQAVDHLVARGHERIAFLGWPEGSITGDERYRGYGEGLAAAGIDPSPEHVRRVGNGLVMGRNAAARWLTSRHPPTAIVCSSDVLAAGALRAADDRGVTVGSDLAVIGFDDTRFAPFLSPPLSSVRQPLESAAEVVVAQAIRRIEFPGKAVEARLLCPELVLRSST